MGRRCAQTCRRVETGVNECISEPTTNADHAKQRLYLQPPSPSYKPSVRPVDAVGGVLDGGTVVEEELGALGAPEVVREVRPAQPEPAAVWVHMVAEARGAGGGDVDPQVGARE
eukprot:8694639-Alexandrium_andersonii.AAC.1